MLLLLSLPLLLLAQAAVLVAWSINASAPDGLIAKRLCNALPALPKEPTARVLRQLTTRPVLVALVFAPALIGFALSGSVMLLVVGTVSAALLWPSDLEVLRQRPRIKHLWERLSDKPSSR